MPSRSRAMPKEAQMRLRKALKALALKIAKVEKIPYWKVLTNVAMAKIAKYTPSTLNDLRLISEVPPSQARKYSDKIFECVDIFVEKFERELREKNRVEESKRAHDPFATTSSVRSCVVKRDYSHMIYPPGLGYDKQYGSSSTSSSSSSSKYINDPSYWLRPRKKNRKNALPPRDSLLSHVTIFRRQMSNPWQYFKKHGAKEALERKFGVELDIISMRPFHVVCRGSPDVTRELERHLHDIVSMYRKPRRVRGVSNTDLNFQHDEIWPHSTTYYRRMPRRPRLVRAPVLKMYAWGCGDQGRLGIGKRRTSREPHIVSSKCFPRSMQEVLQLNVEDNASSFRDQMSELFEPDRSGRNHLLRAIMSPEEIEMKQKMNETNGAISNQEISIPILRCGHYHSLIIREGTTREAGNVWAEALIPHRVSGLKEESHVVSATSFGIGSACVTGVNPVLRKVYHRDRRALRAMDRVTMTSDSERNIQLREIMRRRVDDLGYALRKQAERAGCVYVWGDHTSSQLGLGLIVRCRLAKEKKQEEDEGDTKQHDSDDDSENEDEDEDEDLPQLPMPENVKSEITETLTKQDSIRKQVSLITASAIRAAVLGGTSVGVSAAATMSSILVSMASKAVADKIAAIELESGNKRRGRVKWDPKEESRLLNRAESQCMRRVRVLMKTSQGQKLFLSMMRRRETLRYRSKQLKRLTRKLLPMSIHAVQRRIQNYENAELRVHPTYSNSEYVEKKYVELFTHLQSTIARYYERFALCRTRVLSENMLIDMMKSLGMKNTNRLRGRVHDVLAKTLNVEFGSLNHNERVHIMRRNGCVDLLCFESFLLRGDTTTTTTTMKPVEKGADEDTFLKHVKIRERHLQEEEEEDLSHEQNEVMRALLDMKRNILKLFSSVFKETDRSASLKSITTDMMLNMRADTTRKYRKQCRLTQSQVRHAQRDLVGLDVYDAEFEIDSDEMEDSSYWTKKYDERANRSYWHNKLNGKIKYIHKVELISRLTRATRISRGSFSNQPVRLIAAGRSHVLALTVPGQLYSWGSNRKGQLGVGDLESRVVPTTIHIKHITAISPIWKIRAGADQSAVITKEGLLFTWGCNSCGQLGVGDEKNIMHSSPERVHIPKVRGEIKRAVDVRRESHLSFQESEVARKARLNHAFQEAMRMGAQSTGQEVQDVSLGDSHILVLIRPCLLRLPRALHRSVVVTPLFSAGSTKYGQCGIFPVPGGCDALFTLTQVVDLSKERLVQIATGARHCLALNVRGQLFTWGWNHSGQLGEKQKGEICFKPTLVSTMSDKFVVSIGAGQRHSLCAAYHDVIFEPGHRGRVLDMTTKRCVKIHCPYMLNSRRLKTRLVHRCLDCEISFLCPFCARRNHHGHRVCYVLSDFDVSCEQPFVDHLAEIFGRVCPVSESDEG